MSNNPRDKKLLANFFHCLADDIGNEKIDENKFRKILNFFYSFNFNIETDHEELMKYCFIGYFFSNFKNFSLSQINE